MATRPCVDQDGDHDFKGDDCDDNDPKRHHATDIDPFPDPPNCCGYNLGKAPGSPDEHKDFTGDPLLCPMQRCGDGIDESCRGGLTNDPANDTKCVVDADCDGYPAPPLGNDCDDHDPSVHPGAPEICGNGKDDNCNGIVDDGCVPCDLDGDGYERTDPANGCPDANDKHPGMIDCNDYDSGVFPGETTTLGGTEGGMTTIGRLTASLRGDCRKVYEDTGTTGTTKIAPFAGTLAGDADCNGTAFEGCPKPSRPAATSTATAGRTRAPAAIPRAARSTATTTIPPSIPARPTSAATASRRTAPPTRRAAATTRTATATWPASTATTPTPRSIRGRPRCATASTTTATGSSTRAIRIRTACRW